MTLWCQASLLAFTCTTCWSSTKAENMHNAMATVTPELNSETILNSAYGMLATKTMNMSRIVQAYWHHTDSIRQPLTCFLQNPVPTIAPSASFFGGFPPKHSQQTSSSRRVERSRGKEHPCWEVTVDQLISSVGMELDGNYRDGSRPRFCQRHAKDPVKVGKTWRRGL